MPHWTEIKSEADWQTALEQSMKSPVVIMKHSTTCPISANAWREFERYLEDAGAKEAALYYMVKVIESRPISLKIAEDIGVRHESPQIILLEKGKPSWNTSHYDITARSLREVLS